MYFQGQTKTSTAMLFMIPFSWDFKRGNGDTSSRCLEGTVLLHP